MLQKFSETSIRYCATLRCRNRMGKRKMPVNPMLEQAKTRRKFLMMLGASPLIAGSGILGSGLAALLNAAPLEEKHFFGWLENLEQSDDTISSPDQALNVMDFEPAARK